MQESRYGRELIVDETFASFYRPGEASTGSVWDALAAPVLALPEKRRRRVLLLGVGGGSVARIVRAIAPGARIVGVELDREVVRAARRWFDIDELGLELVVDDARAFLERDRRQFDVVIEDVFIGRGDDVRKPDWLPEPGLRLAAARVARGGLLVSNTLDEGPATVRLLGTLFPALVRIDVQDYDNRIVAAGPAGLGARGLRRAVAGCPVLAGSLGALGFRTLPDARRRGTASRSG